MTPEQVGIVLETTFSCLAGVYAWLFGAGRVGGTSPPMTSYRARWGPWLKLGGPLIIVFALARAALGWTAGSG